MPNKILFYTSASDKLKAGGGMVVLNGRICIAAVWHWYVGNGEKEGLV